MARTDSKLTDDALWFKDAVIYQVHVKSYYDKNGDGIGDIRGITAKLDHLSNLGVSAVWVLPFYPSPLKDDGYDIADYYNIHPQYGTLRDFKELLREAHKRGIRVITELVINHTSDQHAWFQRARRSKPGSRFRDFYVWSDTPEKYQDARIIFKDFETSNWAWDPLAKAYYWHRFYAHQPDLNFDNPQVQKEILRVADFWLELGVDGLRLDAVPYLYEREGTNCENLPETYAFLKKLRGHIDRKFKNKMLLAEANQWPEDAVAYFGDGKACHMAFHFPLMPRMFMSLQMEDRFPIVDILEQTPEVPLNGQWAIFLRNHDELTLEMVTDEERDYMYRVYAKDPRTKINLGIRRRLMPLLGNNRKKVELMNTLLFSLPGSPIIYYGDEIGMGDNYYLGDRNGVRTPMQWSSDKNAGFSKANPQQLYLPVIIDPEYHFEALNVENQEGNPSSLFWWMRRVIGMRKKFKAFSRGTVEFLLPENPKILAFLRCYEEEVILVVVNLSRFSQVAELDLAAYENYLPQEMFSGNHFPPIKRTPYMLTFGPYDHFWLALRKEEWMNEAAKSPEIPSITVKYHWESILDEPYRDRLVEKVLPRYLVTRRWFSRKASQILGIEILDGIFLNAFKSALLILRVSFSEGLQEIYFVPLSYGLEGEVQTVVNEQPHALMCKIVIGDEIGYLYDGVFDEQLQLCLLDMIRQKKKIKTFSGEVTFSPGKKLRQIPKSEKIGNPHLVKAEQSNTSVNYDNRFILKIYRRLEEGLNPDMEVTRYLTEKKRLEHVSPYVGSIEYCKTGGVPMLLGVCNDFVANQGDSWSYALDNLNRYYEHLLTHTEKYPHPPKYPHHFLAPEEEHYPPWLAETVGVFFLDMIQLLGERTREMHDALASEKEDPEFYPEPFSTLYQRSVYQAMRGQTRRVLHGFRKSVRRLPKEDKKLGNQILAAEEDILKVYSGILKKKINAMKVRIHGDYHLGQVLFTGKDFVIIDFEGEPARALSERRLKRSPLRDIAGMIRSFHYAAYSGLILRASIRPEDVQHLLPWAEAWYYHTSRIFLKSYLTSNGQAAYLPKDPADFTVLLNCFMLDKAVYELNYEINNRPEWTGVPLRGICNILQMVEQDRKS